METKAATGSGLRLRAGRREWIGLAVLALPCLLYAMDLTVPNLAVPHLSAGLQPSCPPEQGCSRDERHPDG